MKTISSILLMMLFYVTACTQPYTQWWEDEGYFMPCDNDVNYSGGKTYPTEVRVELGTATGNVYINFNTFGIPDKIDVFYDGVQRYGTAYRGELSYDYDVINDEPGYYRSEFTSSLTGRIDYQWNTTYPDFAHYPWDGYPKVYLPLSSRSWVFQKTTSTPTYITVKIYAPMDDTDWTFNIECPQ